MSELLVKQFKYRSSQPFAAVSLSELTWSAAIRGFHIIFHEESENSTTQVNNLSSDSMVSKFRAHIPLFRYYFQPFLRLIVFGTLYQEVRNSLIHAAIWLK